MTDTKNASIIEKDENSISKKDLKSVYWRSMFEMASINYERFQALGFLYSMTPIIKKLYPNKEDRSNAMKRHMRMYNSHPWMISPILGAAIALEEKNASGEDTTQAIDSVKVGLMGPFAGIGDSLFWGTLRPLLAGFGASFALQGNVFGPILFLLIWNVINFGFRAYSLRYGYEKGVSMLGELRTSNIIKKVSDGASVLGLMILGVLVAQWVNVQTPIQWTTGEEVVTLQGVLDDIMPGILNLITTMAIVKLLRKRITPNKLILGIFIVALILSLVGFLAV